jgi:glycosyltransferase involved in cell wall biosynthesis
VLASPAHRAAIEAACSADASLAGMNWLFAEVAGWKLAPAQEPKWERTYNLLWQLAALRCARPLHRRVRFDAVHHLTWGGVRAPTFLGALGPPLIIGPMGGGETCPASLRDEFSPRARMTERLRDISNATITYNPIVRDGLQKAAVIVLKTPDTAPLLTATMRRKSFSFLELSLRPDQIGAPRLPPQGSPRLLFVGRLFYWKGAHIAIRALANLSVRMPDARLTILGSGPERDRLTDDARAFGVADRVDFVPWVPRDRVVAIYDRHDLFVFPSLHDSSSNVVLESLARGLPVLCLDLGGPRHIVTPASGIVVQTSGMGTADVANAMADEICALFAEPARLDTLSAAAVARATEFLLPSRVAKFYRLLGRSLGWPDESDATPKMFAGAGRLQNPMPK